VAHRVVAVLGGRYSAGLGIDVDAGEAEVERWFVAAALFGARISARVAERAAAAARHLSLACAQAGVSGLAGLAAACELDVRDLESGLVRLGLAHGRAMAGCPGGQACTALRQPVPPGAS